MCFALGFQQNHVQELGNLSRLVLAAREAGRKPFVNLDLLTSVSLMRRILDPVRLLALMEMARREISGKFELTEICEKCRGNRYGENHSDWDPEDVDKVFDDLMSCFSCHGAGHRLAYETTAHLGLLDKRSCIEALKKCRLSYFEAQRVLRRFRENPPSSIAQYRVKKPIFTIWLC